MYISNIGRQPTTYSTLCIFAYMLRRGIWGQLHLENFKTYLLQVILDFSKICPEFSSNSGNLKNLNKFHLETCHEGCKKLTFYADYENFILKVTKCIQNKLIKI